MAPRSPANWLTQPWLGLLTAVAVIAGPLAGCIWRADVGFVLGFAPAAYLSSLCDRPHDQARALKGAGIAVLAAGLLALLQVAFGPGWSGADLD